MTKRLGGRGPEAALLFSALVGAASLAYFGSSSSPAPRAKVESRTSETSSAKGVEGAAVHQAPPRVAPPTHPSVPVEGLSDDPLYLDPMDDLEIPTVERALAERKPDIAPRADVASQGVRALLPELRCAAPSVPVESAVRGPGGYGCEVELDEERPAERGAPEKARAVPWGRYVRRLKDDSLEVGEYERGVRKGVFERFRKDGTLESSGEYVGEERNGVFLEYDAGGHHFATRSYDHGKLSGLSIVYSGRKVHIELYSGGVRLHPETRKPMSDEEAAERWAQAKTVAKPTDSEPAGGQL